MLVLLKKNIRKLALCILVGGLLPLSALSQEPAKAPVDRTLKGDAACTRCHDESEQRPILAMYKTRHGVKADARTPGCQSCHGASEAHLKGAGTGGSGKRPSPDMMFVGANKSDASAINETCLTCHKAGKRTLWQGSQHQSHDVACTSCHQVHTKDGDRTIARATQRETCYTCHMTQRAEGMRMSTHPVQAGKVTCSDCHNPHGSEGPKLMADISVKDTCFTCHAEKRGPFLWEHPPASDDCMNCHTPHGSTNPPLLKARSPWLCQNCHGDGAPHPGNIYSGASLPGGTVANIVSAATTSNPINPLTGARIGQNAPPSQLAFRACSNCHTQIHGSNHPGGRRFTR